MGVAISSLAKDCREFSEEGSAGDGFLCVWGAISTVIGFAVLGDRGYQFYGLLGQRLTENGIQVIGINKRDEIPQLEARLSSALSVEVRHVGIWEDSDSQEAKSLSARSGGADKVVRRDVFGANFQGGDMHFTYMGERDDGSHFRFGLGPGPETENNRRRLQGRAVHKYNNQFFDSGGLDFVGVTDPGNDNHGNIYMTPEDPNEFTWLVEQVSCYFNGWTYLGSPSHAQGVNFQVYNTYDVTTVAAGAIAAFSSTVKSAISEMEVVGGILGVEQCYT
jgi:hypothetical protein